MSGLDVIGDIIGKITGEPQSQDSSRIKVPLDALHKYPRPVIIPEIPKGKGATVVFGREDAQRQVVPGITYVEVTGPHPELSRHQLLLMFSNAGSRSTEVTVDLQPRGGSPTVVLYEGQEPVVLDKEDANRRLHRLNSIRGLTVLMPGAPGEIVALKIPNYASSTPGAGARVQMEVGVDDSGAYNRAFRAYKAGKAALPNGGVSRLPRVSK